MLCGEDRMIRQEVCGTGFSILDMLNFHCKAWVQGI
jgi:hypothetical protein